MGWDKFTDITHNTGGDYHTFPNLFTQLRIGIIYISLNVVYIIWLLGGRQNRQPDRQLGYEFICFNDVIKYVSVFLLIAFVAYPVGNDVYLYLQYGLMSLNGVNPFTHGAGGFASELSPLIRWGQSSTYGPVAQLLFMAAATATSLSPILAVYLFKLFCLLIHIFNAYLVWRLLRFSAYRSSITAAYLVNPLLLFEQVASAHIDVLISTVVLLLAACLRYRRYAMAMAVAWVGFLIKTLPIVWLPLLSVFLIRQRRWLSLAIVIACSLIAAVALEQTVLPTVGAWKSLLNPGAAGTANSLHKLLKVSLDSAPGISANVQQLLLSKFKLIAYAGFAAFYIWTLLKVYGRQRYRETNLIVDIGWITLVLFLLATPWLMPWYASVLLAIVALNPESRVFALTTLSFCLSSSCVYALMGVGAASSVVMVGLPATMLLLAPKLSRSWPVPSPVVEPELVRTAD
ncbi:hypothetical protein [Leptolyngbya sp. FACHB-261]|uniref:hypothetical protein n=1 Tax=Leptolyngbya sp. FACHB-261 TaxID=2692806 RepID=UPI001686FE76|nr:hypothetical protein [Leptolyngbya sp. FACHB-261]